MKKILLLFFGVILIAFTSFYFSKNESNGHGGRCTGSANCTACSNCSRCGHCGAGGTCGVCRGSSSVRDFSSSGKSSKTTKSKTSKDNNYKKKNAQSFENIINKPNIIKLSRSVNIFEKPSFRSKVLENLPPNTKLFLISKVDLWYKVKVKKNGKTGYIYAKDAK